MCDIALSPLAQIAKLNLTFRGNVIPNTKNNGSAQSPKWHMRTTFEKKLCEKMSSRFACISVSLQHRITYANQTHIEKLINDASFCQFSLCKRNCMCRIALRVIKLLCSGPLCGLCDLKRCGAQIQNLPIIRSTSNY